MNTGADYDQDMRIRERAYALGAKIDVLAQEPTTEELLKEIRGACFDFLSATDPAPTKFALNAIQELLRPIYGGR